MLFYKYQRPSDLAFTMLRHGEIFFASPSELNDASECRPRYIFKGSEELWQRLAHYILLEICCSSDYFSSHRNDTVTAIIKLSDSIGTRLKRAARNRDVGLEAMKNMFCDALQQCMPEGGLGVNLRYLIRLIENFFARDFPVEIAEDKYIASFSRNATNSTMWGHYADAERGFVMVYESTTGSIQVQSPIALLSGSRPSTRLEGAMEIGHYRDEHIELKDVRYGRRPPKVNAFHRLIHKFSYSEREEHYDVPLLIGGDAEKKEEESVGFVKYSDWRYEKEVRAFFPTFDKLLPDARVLQMGTPHLKGLIFGPRMSAEHKARAVLGCHLLMQARGAESESSNEFQFFQARQTVDRFDFEILPIGILDGYYFSPDLPVKRMKELDADTAARVETTAQTIKSP